MSRIQRRKTHSKRMKHRPNFTEKGPFFKLKYLATILNYRRFNSRLKNISIKCPLSANEIPCAKSCKNCRLMCPFNRDS